MIAVYNEIRSLPKLLKQLSMLGENIKVIIVDDGSNDGSNELLEKYVDEIKIIKNDFNFGKGYSIRQGVYHAESENIIFIDGDLEININLIPQLIDLYEKNKNCTLIGKRWDKNENLNFEINRFGNYIINSFFNFLYKVNLNDVLCCVRIIRSDLIKKLNLKSNRFSIEVETLANLVLHGEKLVEAKVDYKRRSTREGKKLKAIDAWEIILVMLKTKFDFRKIKN